jgi:hypothetical protein
LAAAQLTDQSTPAAARSLATSAVSVVECAAPVSCAYTVFGSRLMLTVGGWVMAIVALADFVVSVAEVPVRVTVPPAGTTEGAVYTDWYKDVKLVGDGGLKDPQALDAHVAVKITPPEPLSFTMFTLNPSVPLIVTDVGTVPDTETLMGSGTIVYVALLLCEGLLVTVAVM